MIFLRAILIVTIIMTSTGFWGCASSDNIQTNPVGYRVDKKKFVGFLAVPDPKKSLGVGVVVVHEWWGHNDYARERASELAKLGYTAFALDMYGDGKTADHPKDAGKFAKMVMKNIKVAGRRFDKAIEILKNRPEVDKTKIAAIGYCFGGGVVLSMASLGKDLDAVVSFHGGLKLPVKAKRGKFKGKMLVLNGEKDPMVSKKDIQKFKRKMMRAKIQVEVVNYPEAVHAFTNPGATKLGKKFKLPLAYNKEADEDSWRRMLELFEQVFRNKKS
ncbi:dienelactone hydrolase family protein [Bacteriovoracaceae bacterium]|nr:dienelactone hydrolase family protein [Bacteriovoracaceae bacterium]